MVRIFKGKEIGKQVLKDLARRLLGNLAEELTEEQIEQLIEERFPEGDFLLTLKKLLDQFDNQSAPEFFAAMTKTDRLQRDFDNVEEFLQRVFPELSKDLLKETFVEAWLEFAGQTPGVFSNERFQELFDDVVRRLESIPAGGASDRAVPVPRKRPGGRRTDFRFNVGIDGDSTGTRLPIRRPLRPPHRARDFRGINPSPLTNPLENVPTSELPREEAVAVAALRREHESLRAELERGRAILVGFGDDLFTVEDKLTGMAGDTSMLGNTLDDMLMSAQEAGTGLEATLGKVLPELGDKTDELTIKIEDSMARAREAVEDLAAGLEDVLGEALRGEIESFEDFGRRVLEILREIGFGILEEEGLDPKSLLRKAVGSIFGDGEERRQGGESATEAAGEAGPFGALPVVSDEVATALQNAGVAAGLLEGSGLGASDVLGGSLAGEALNAALAAATETTASQTLVAALAQLTAAATLAATALSALGASGGGGGGGFLGSLGGFFGNVSPQGGLDVAGFQGGGLNFGGFERTSIPGGIGGFAAGGNPITGLPAMVGERGPEIIVPRVPTTVIPNEVLGGGGMNLSVTINAPGADAAGLESVRQEVRALRGVVTDLNRGIEPRALAAVTQKANRGGGFARTVGRRR